MARIGRPPKDTPKPVEELNFYGLHRLGYDEFPLTGDMIADQREIEAVCFRIGHRPEEGGLGRFQHFKNFVDLRWNHPSLNCTKKFIWHDWSTRVIQKFCTESEVGIAGCTSSGKSSPAALWVVANYLMNPTHVKSFVLSTTIKGAKDRVWKDVIEFWEAVSSPEGKLLKATHEIQGLNFSGDGFGNTSGIYLHAADKSSEASAIDKLIGAKAAKSGNPGASFEELIASPEYSYLRKEGFDEDYLRDLVARLQELAPDRMGPLIVVIDEATGVSEGVLNSIMANLKPGNPGFLQVIVLGNPASRFDSHGTFCEPDAGWDSITLMDEEWRTKSGGVCIRFDGEKNPRIVHKNERLTWMLRQQDIDAMAKKYGENSLYYFRMVRGFWSPLGADTGVYSEADFIQSGALDKTVWGFERPRRLAGYDPSFTSGGDRAVCWFGLLGKDPEGKMILQLEEEVTIKPNMLDKATPVPAQMVKLWRDECLARGVGPECACFDATGGGVTFAALVNMLWSPSVQGVSSGGKASKAVLPGEKTPEGKPVVAADRFGNKASEIWVGAMPFLRSGQIRGVTKELAKEICSRQNDKTGMGDARVIKIESKRVYKGREKGSPDSSDAFFLLVEHAKTKHGFKPSEKAPVDTPATRSASKGTWNALVARARRITYKKSLRN